MIKVYCDNGACPDKLKALQREGSVELIMFKYENKNRHIKNSGQPSAATWNDMKKIRVYPDFSKGFHEKKRVAPFLIYFYIKNLVVAPQALEASNPSARRSVGKG